MIHFRQNHENDGGKDRKIHIVLSDKVLFFFMMLNDDFGKIFAFVALNVIFNTCISGCTESVMFRKTSIG